MRAALVVVALLTGGVDVAYVVLALGQDDAGGPHPRVALFAVFVAVLAVLFAAAAFTPREPAIQLTLAAICGLFTAGALAVLSIGWAFLVIAVVGLGVLARIVATEPRPGRLPLRYLAGRMVAAVVPITVLTGAVLFT